MPLWGKLFEEPLTGTVILSEDASSVTGANTIFTEELSVRDVVAFDVLTEDRYRVVKIISDSEMEVEPAATSDYTDADGTYSQVPKYLPLQTAIAETALVSTADVQDPSARPLGIRSPGWTTVQSYTDQNGNTRRRVETLVALKS
jgi:hypothetical protein